jgi:hypothetical protein
MKPITKFKKWWKKASFGRGMLCHFYIEQNQNNENQKQYYDKIDYAYLNLLSGSRNWIVKGTANHGIKSRRGKCSQVPCLNCFEVNEKFFTALKKSEEEDNNRFALGILLNKRRIKGRFHVIDVSIKRPHGYIPPNKCHYYDNVYFRKALIPFNYCDVVRVEIPHSGLFGMPFAELKAKEILGILSRKRNHRAICKEIKKKHMNNVQVFSLLPL